MSIRGITLFSLSFGLIVHCQVGLAQETEEFRANDSSAEFVDAYVDVKKKIEGSSFLESLETLGVGAINDDAGKKKLADIRALVNMPSFGLGKDGEKYDVVLQPGHYQRKEGKVGTSGKLVTEQQLVAFITASAARFLMDKGRSVLVVPADGLKGKYVTKGFLSFHADGSVPACKTGPSIGYQAKSSMLAMHAIGLGLSQALGYSYEQFKKDNLTANMTEYYAFKHMNASSFKGILEVGELTCEKTEEQLVLAADKIGVNIGRAIHFALGE